MNPKKWTRDYDCCVTCGTTDSPHHGLGRCKKCYRKFDYHRSDKARNRILKYHYKTKFGITPEERQTMIDKQGGVCLICSKKPNKERKWWAIDHDHAIEKITIRGMLCHNCNKGLGNFFDNPVILMEAIRYLQKNYQKNLATS